MSGTLILQKTNIGVSAVVETDRCNPEWIKSMNAMDAVIVPSEHVKNIILNTGPLQLNYLWCLSGILNRLIVMEIMSWI